MDMWVAPYHRDSMPEGLDHSGFGVASEPIPLLDFSGRAKFKRTAISFPERYFPPAEILGGEGQETPFHLRECRAAFSAGFSEPVPGIVFTPDHAFLVDDEPSPRLVWESFWHSELFFSRYVRCDKSTNWTWRIDQTWKPKHEIDELVNFGYHRYYYHYFHWLMDCLPRVWLLANHHDATKAKWVVGPLTQEYHVASLALFDVTPDDCLRLEENHVVQFRHAVIPAFEFIEPLNTIFPDFRSGTWNIGWSPEYFEDLRDRGRRKHLSSAGELKVFVSRSDASHRRLRNEVELVRMLEERGFVVVAPGELRFAEQVDLFARARLIVGVHGAGLTNLIWASPGCTVVELRPDGFGDVGYRFSAQMCGHRFITVMCRVFEHPLGLAYADMGADIPAIKRLVDRII